MLSNRLGVLGSLVICRLSCAVLLLGVFLFLVSFFSVPNNYSELTLISFATAVYLRAVVAVVARFPSSVLAGSPIMARLSTIQTLIHRAVDTLPPPAQQLPVLLEDTTLTLPNVLCLRLVPLLLTMRTMRLHHPCTRLTRTRPVLPLRLPQQEEIRSIPSSRMVGSS